MKRNDGIVVYFCDSKGGRLSGKIPGSSDILILLAKANLFGRYGCYIADETVEDELIPYSCGYTSIKVSAPGSGSLLIASRKGESRKFQRLKLILPAGVEESVAHKRLFDAADNPRWVCDGPALPSAPEEEPATASESMDTDTRVFEAPSSTEAVAPRISGDAFIDMTDKEFLSAVTGFCTDVLSHEYGMTEWLNAIVSMRKNVELRRSTSESEIKAGFDGADRNLAAREYALERIKLLFPEVDDYFNRLLPAAKKIRKLLERLPSDAE